MKDRTILSRVAACAAAGLAFVAAGALLGLSTSELPATWAREASSLARLEAAHSGFGALLLVTAGLVVLVLGHIRSSRRGLRLTAALYAGFVTLASLTLVAAPALARL